MTQDAKILLTIGIITTVLLVGTVFFLSKTTSPSVGKNNVDGNILIKSDSNKISTASAKITIVEFGDYQCPACGQAHPIINQVLKSYPNKVSFVFRNFPLPQHQNAILAAEAAEAAGEQGKYWQMHALLYENQAEWSESTNALNIFENYAKKTNLDIAQFNNSVAKNKYLNKITTDKNDGLNIGVDSTPTFYYLVKDASGNFSKGTKLQSFSFETFKKVIEQN